MELAHQQRVIAVVNGMATTAGPFTSIAARSVGSGASASPRQSPGAKGIGIGFEIDRRTPRRKGAGIFLFLNGDHVVAVIHPDDVQHVGVKTHGSFQLHA